MIYGVAFTQLVENELVGILKFKSEAKAKLVYRIMSGLEELSSLDEQLHSVLESSDFDEVPEFEEDDISEQMIIENHVVNIINLDDILDIE